MTEWIKESGLTQWVTMFSESLGILPIITIRSPKRVRTDLRKFFFSYRIVNTWNQLPVELKESKSLNIFKISLRKLML